MKKYSPSERHRRATLADLSAIPEGQRYNVSRVLHVLADHADQKLLITNVGIDCIAKQLQISALTVKRCLPKLEQAGLIVVRRIRRHGNMYMLLMGDLEKSEMEILTEVFQKGLNIEQVSEFLSNTMLILRNGVLSNTLDAKSLKAGFSKYQHDDSLTGERIKNRVKTIETPPWLNPEIFEDFVEHRASLKARMSPKAQQLLITKLDEHRTEGHDPNELLNTAIMSGWKSVYPPKPERNNGRSKKYDRFEAELERPGPTGVVDAVGDVQPLAIEQKT